MSLCLINKTRFYTQQTHARDSLIGEIDDGYRFWNYDDVKEKKKPQECGSTTNNNQAGKE